MAVVIHRNYSVNLPNINKRINLFRQYCISHQPSMYRAKPFQTEICISIDIQSLNNEANK